MNAIDHARELFDALSDTCTRSGHVSGRARDLVPEFEIAIAAAIAAEREACAQIADDYDGPGIDGKFMNEAGNGRLTAQDIAKAIRGRGEQ